MRAAKSLALVIGVKIFVYFRVKPEDYVPTEHRPWEMENKMRQISRLREVMVAEEKEKSNLPTPIPDERWWIFRGDLVKVLVGKDKGKIGKVNYIVRELNHVYVAGLNCKCERKGENMSIGYKGEYTLVERPLEVPNQVALIDPSDYEATEIEWEYTAAGERVRKSVRTGRLIPLRAESGETYEYKVVTGYQECAKDTDAKSVAKVTYQPTVQSFEQEIMEEMGIEETREYKKTYWY